MRKSCRGQSLDLKKLKFFKSTLEDKSSELKSLNEAVLEYILDDSQIQEDVGASCDFTSAIIVNLGTGYETLGISKAGKIQSQLDVEPTVALHNLLFLVRNLISNKLVEAFDWLSCRKKRVVVGFCAGSRPKKRTKT